MLHDFLVAVKKPFIKLIPLPEPECWTGAGMAADIHRALHQLGVKRPLVVTDPGIMQLGLLNEMLGALAAEEINYSVFDGVTPDPSFDQVRQGVECYQGGQCDGVIAFGGGSPMDCAKSIAASIATGKDISALTGLLKVRRRIPPIVAIPTTAGTGSEATVVAVISDHDSKKKLVVSDPAVVPQLAILDPTLMTGLPPKITAETGVDALTHAIESYLSDYASPYTRRQAIAAMKEIFTHLPQVYGDGNSLDSREAMAIASFKAGIAFTRTYVGYVHAIAHQLGGYYHVPHGLANAIVLPKVLEFNMVAAKTHLAELAREVLQCSEADDSMAARIFVDQVSALLQALHIPEVVQELQANDIPELARRATEEAFGVYPVPRVMRVEECEQLLHTLLARPAQALQA